MSVAGGCDFEAIGGHGPNGGGLLGQSINGSQQRQHAASTSELALLLRGKATGHCEGSQVQALDRPGAGA